jgi:hypothetical protein
VETRTQFHVLLRKLTAHARLRETPIGVADRPVVSVAPNVSQQQRKRFLWWLPLKNLQVLGRTNRLLSFDTKRTAQKVTPPIIFIAAGMFLPSCYLATIGGHTERPIVSPSIRHRPHRKSRIQQFFYCCVYSFRRHVFTDPLPSKDRGDTHWDTQTNGRDLWSTGLRWAQAPWYVYQGS